ncbi:MAG: P-loop NTPase family protein, partial [Planctomycetota bacterium]
MSPLGEAFRRVMERGGAPASAGTTPDAHDDAPVALPEQASRRFASAPTQEIPAYPSAPPAGAAVGQAAEALPEPETEPLASFAPPLGNGVPSGASAFLSRATRVPTFAEGPLPPGCDELAGLRASLLSLGLGQPPATIMVAGASSPVATTAVAVGLAGEIARDLAHQVLLIDANVSKPGAMRMLDVDPVLEFADVLEGRAFAGEAIVHSETDNLSALVLRPDPVTGRSRATAESFLGDVASSAMGELQAAFDYVVVDAGAVSKSAVPKVLAARAT